MSESKYAGTSAEGLLIMYVQLEHTLKGWFPGPRQAEARMRCNEMKYEILRRMEAHRESQV